MNIIPNLKISVFYRQSALELFCLSFVLSNQIVEYGCPDDIKDFANRHLAASVLIVSVSAFTGENLPAEIVLLFLNSDELLVSSGCMICGGCDSFLY